MNEIEKIMAEQQRKREEANKPLIHPVQQDVMRRIDFQKQIVAHHIWQCCLNCLDWQDGTQKAHQGNVGCAKFRQMPPPHIIVNGCPDWEGDIPF